MMTVNGQPVEFEPGTTVAQLIEKLHYVVPHLIVRVNGRLVGRDAYDRTVLEDGDVIDAIHPMVGG